MRVIDEELNCIIGNDKIKTNKCYNLWGQSKRCEICIYQKAFEIKKPVIKIVDFSEKTYIVKAVSIMIGLNKYLLEFIDDVSGTLYYESKFTQFNGNSYTIKVNNKLQGIVKDSLTNLYNRNYLESRLKIDINKVLKNKKHISLCMIDIDYFKQVNDTYGHLVGDEILKQFSNIMQQIIKSNLGWVARYGGEEFIIVLPNIDREKALEISETIRGKVESNIFKINENEIKITCSIGICSVENQKITVYELIEKADENLYKAKYEGRNRVV